MPCSKKDHASLCALADEQLLVVFLLLAECTACGCTPFFTTVYTAPVHQFLKIQQSNILIELFPLIFSHLAFEYQKQGSRACMYTKEKVHD